MPIAHRQESFFIAPVDRCALPAFYIWFYFLHFLHFLHFRLQYCYRFHVFKIWQ